MSAPSAPEPSVALPEIPGLAATLARVGDAVAHEEAAAGLRAELSRYVAFLVEQVERERRESHAAFAVLKAAALETTTGHLWGCPESGRVEAARCPIGSCRRVQAIMQVPTVTAYLARAAALEQLCQLHIRHDPLCPWWQEPRSCSCGLVAMLKFYADTGLV